MQMRENVEDENLYKEILKMLSTLSFGSITIVVQDGKVIQLEKNEKVRLK
ncbi:YezD family protein [Pseudogracilibacillus sp. SO30301A]